MHVSPSPAAASQRTAENGGSLVCRDIEAQARLRECSVSFYTIARHAHVSCSFSPLPEPPSCGKGPNPIRPESPPEKEWELAHIG